MVNFAEEYVSVAVAVIHLKNKDHQELRVRLYTEYIST